MPRTHDATWAPSDSKVETSMRFKQRKLPFWLRFIETPSEGGSGDTDNKDDKNPPGDDNTPPPSDDEEPLGPAGLKALQAERAARADAEKAARDAQTALAAEKAAHAKAVQQIEAAKVESLKLQVAIAEGIPTSLASRLVGATQEELSADAKQIKESLKPGFVAPIDPSQGQDRGGDGGGSVEAGRELFQRLRGKKSK